MRLTGTGTAPALTIKPPVAPVGQVIFLTGTNFPPNSNVAIGFDKMPPSRTVTADANGAFSTPFLVMSHVEIGKRTLKAEALAGSVPDLTIAVPATAGILLTKGTLQPPDFVNRN